MELTCCGRIFAMKHHFMRHQRSVHGPFKPLTCNECQKVFLTQGKLYYHMQRHGEKQHQCNKCKRTFHMKKDLKSHELTVHQHLRPFACDICGNHYSTKLSMQNHRTRCASNLDQASPHKIFGKVGAPRPDLWCSLCDFRCMRPDTLKKHIGIQHPELDWQELAQCLCLKCLRQFSTAEQLEEHRTKHHPTLQCDICKAILTSELSLERHKKIHTAKDRPFTCSVSPNPNE